MKINLNNNIYVPSINFKAIPKDMTIIVDTREQKPLFEYEGINKIRGTLHNGDYSIKGFEDVFAVERKMTSDFFSYIGKEFKDRTYGKLQRLKDFEFAALVVEADIDDLLSPQVYTKMQPEHVIGFLTSAHSKYGIVTFLHRDRRLIEVMMMNWMSKFYRMKRSE